MEEEQVVNQGFKRIVRLLLSMIDSAELQDKQKLMKLSSNFNNAIGDFVALLYEEAGIDDADVTEFNEKVALPVDVHDDL